MSGIDFFNDDGQFVIKAYFAKDEAIYDPIKGTVVVKDSGIKCKDNDIAKGKVGDVVRNAKPQYMTFKLKRAGHLHCV